MRKFDCILAVVLLLVVVLMGQQRQMVESLSNYCSAVNRTELVGKLETCYNLKSLDVTASTTTTSTTTPPPTPTIISGGSRPSTLPTAATAANITTQLSVDQEILKEKYDTVLRILDKVLTSINDGNATRNDTIHLFLDILLLMKTANSHSKLQYCIVSICSLFKNCEFPIDIDYRTFESDALVASRVAALLTAITFNERVESKRYLTKLNIYSMARLALSESENIYDVKIIFPRSPDSDRFMVHGSKDLKSKVLEIKDFQQILEDSKNFQWYNKWIAEKKLTNYTMTSNWIYKLNDLLKTLDTSQLNQFNQMMYPSTLELNAQRFVTNITYDCLNGIWNRVVSVPFIYPSGEIRGVVSVSISLNNFDLKQCGEDDDETDTKTTSTENENNETLSSSSSSSSASKASQNTTMKKVDRRHDPFYGTDNCDRISTQCLNIEGKGFNLGSYVCKCRAGYYRPKNGTKTKTGYVYDENSCLKCSEGCDACEDDRPCRKPVPESFKRIALITNLICILICLILVILTWYHMTLKILKTSSPKMLFIVLFGAIVSYSEIIPMYFNPNYFSCTSAQILQLEGFLLAYGGLVLKTWRECKLFYVRSVKTIKITDKSLMKRLGIIMLAGTTYLIAWALRSDSPRAQLKYDPDGLKYETCTITEWNFVSMAFQLAILLWGAVLSVQVRRASIAFKETKLITWAIFNEGVVLCFVIAISVLLETTRVSSYVPFALSFVRIHLTITVMLLLLFSYKIYTIIMARKKPLQSQQLATGMLNNFGGSGKDGEQKSSSVNDETEKERELRIEIQRLYRQLEEMRSLSMRIANPHLIQKGKTRFIYPTKKKTKASAAAKSEIEFSRAVASVHEPEMQSLIESNQPPVKPKKTVPHVVLAEPIEANITSASMSGPSSSATPATAAAVPNKSNKMTK